MYDKRILHFLIISCLNNEKERKEYDYENAFNQESSFHGFRSSASAHSNSNNSGKKEKYNYQDEEMFEDYYTQGIPSFY